MRSSLYYIVYCLDLSQQNLHIKPLQINDLCHIQWHGTNPRPSSASRKDSDNNDISSKKGISSASIINLPAIVVERRIARQRMKRRKDDIDEDALDVNNQVKRQRNSLPNGSTNKNGDIPSLDAATSIKKEMYDTLPVDALEYYVHYVDHDR